MGQSNLHLIKIRYGPFSLACEDMLHLDKRYGDLSNVNLELVHQLDHARKILGSLLSLMHQYS